VSLRAPLMILRSTSFGLFFVEGTDVPQLMFAEVHAHSPACGQCVFPLIRDAPWAVKVRKCKT